MSLTPPSRLTPATSRRGSGRRLIAVLALALACALPSGTRPARADDAAKAAADLKKLEDWLGSQAPKTKDEEKTLRAETEKRLRTFLKDHPDAGTPTFRVKAALADTLYRQKKFDESVKLWEGLLATDDPAMGSRARYGLVQALCGKQDWKTARARLDAFTKEHPEDENLPKLDEFLKKVEVGSSLAVGAAPPPIKAKSLGGEEISLEAWKGKVVLIDFWATWVASSVKLLPALKKTYAELHEKGLEIVGVDGLEKDPAAFKEFLKKEAIPWPQLVTDAKTISLNYAVKALPRNVLVGRDGTVLALDLRDDDLIAGLKAAVEGKPLPERKIKPADKGEKKPAAGDPKKPGADDAKPDTKPAGDDARE